MGCLDRGSLLFYHSMYIVKQGLTEWVDKLWVLQPTVNIVLAESCPPSSSLVLNYTSTTSIKSLVELFKTFSKFCLFVYLFTGNKEVKPGKKVSNILGLQAQNNNLANWPSSTEIASQLEGGGAISMWQVWFCRLCQDETLPPVLFLIASLGPRHLGWPALHHTCRQHQLLNCHWISAWQLM